MNAATQAVQVRLFVAEEKQKTKKFYNIIHEYVDCPKNGKPCPDHDNCIKCLNVRFGIEEPYE